MLTAVGLATASTQPVPYRRRNPVSRLRNKVTWGNSVNGVHNFVKMTSERYNFASTLAIVMYLGKHDAYSILNTSKYLSAAILPCCDRESTFCGGTKCSCKNFPVNINVARSIHTKTPNSIKN